MKDRTRLCVAMQDPRFVYKLFLAIGDMQRVPHALQ
jgi:hypothetical protein